MVLMQSTDREVEPMITLTPEEALAARDWLSDCYWTDLEPEDIADLTDKQLFNGVRRHYDGGWSQFVEDARP